MREARPGAERFGLGDPGLACVSGLLLLSIFPKLDLGFLAWVALVPLLIALDGRGPWAAFGLSYLTGVVFFFGLFYWMSAVPDWNLVDWSLTGFVYLPHYVSLWGLGLAWIRRRTGLPAALVAPPLWVTAEFLRAHASFLSLPWMFLGHSQYLYPPVIQVSALTGAYGLSFLIVLANAAIAETVQHLRHRSSSAPVARGFPARSLSVVALLLVVTLGYGVVILSTAGGDERIRVALIQGNIPQARKWDRAFRQETLERYTWLTRQAAQHAPALIIWPETAVPGDVEHEPDLQQAVAKVAAETKIPLLAGSAEHAKFSDQKLRGKFYNSVYLLSPEGRIVGQYRKIRLVPFGEYTPLRDFVAWPKAIAANSGTFVAGGQFTRFALGDVPFAAVICWEIAFPDLVRQFVNRGAAFMVLATNEAWFGDSAAPYDLLAMTAIRAAENRVAIARSANTGVTALVDPFGRVIRRLRGPDGKDLFVEGVLVGEIPLARDKTFYTVYGDVFAYLMIGATALLLARAWARARGDGHT